MPLFLPHLSVNVNHLAATRPVHSPPIEPTCRADREVSYKWSRYKYLFMDILKATLLPRKSAQFENRPHSKSMRLFDIKMFIQ